MTGMSESAAGSGMIHLPPWHLEYKVFGEGMETLFMFHGFDNDAEDFKCFAPAFGERFKMVSVNLFHHGKSHADLPSDSGVFSDEDLRQVFNSFLNKFGASRCSLLGFSLGGRICLKLIELFPERIDRVILLAPDGLAISPWYKFVTRNYAGRRLFARSVKDPSRFLTIAMLARKLRLVGEKQYKFALAHFNSKEKRLKVYNVWMIFRHILPDLKTVKSNILNQGIYVDVFFGQRDAIIRSSLGKSFQKEIENNCTIHVLDAGHNLIKPVIAEKIKSAIQ